MSYQNSNYDIFEDTHRYISLMFPKDLDLLVLEAKYKMLFDK